jgi:hypothetical protein
MSVRERFALDPNVDTDALGVAVLHVVFGNYLGATLFLTALAWFGLYWRFGFFSNDQFTFVNTLVGVADGHLFIDRAVYGPASGASPGTHLVDGRVYGRNYGIVVISAVWLLALEAVSLVADVRVLVTGLWSFAVIGAAAGVGVWLDRRRLCVLVGTAVGAIAFAGNLLVATPLSAYWYPLLALQCTTALAAAFTAVVLYRLVSRLYTDRLGVAVGLTAALATPLGFWASLPKRHSVTALFVVCVLYTLYRSREADSADVARRFRALTYAWVGPVAWVHAPEGFFLLVAIAVVDLPTARSNGVRDLLVVGLALSVSLLPFFLTNLAISGEPLQPPRLLPGYNGDVLSGDGGAGGTSGSVADSGQFSSGGNVLSRILGQFGASYAVLLDPERMGRIFLRHGYIDSLSPTQDAAVNLSVIESMPLLGAVVAYPLLAARRVARGVSLRRPHFGERTNPVTVVDAFSVVYVLLLLGLALTTLPLHHMFTMRYLHPLYAVGLYWVIRVPAVRRALGTAGQSAVGGFGTTILVGVPLYLGGIAVGDLVLGEAVQLYALTALAVAVAVGSWVLLSTAVGGFESTGAVLLGVATGLTAVYLLVSGITLFPDTGEFLLPLSRAVSERLHFMRLYGSTPSYW